MTEEMKTKQQGICPKCNGNDLNYDAIERIDEGVEYPYTCNDCGFMGSEWYKLTFDYHMNTGGDIL